LLVLWFVTPWQHFIPSQSCGTDEQRFGFCACWWTVYHRRVGSNVSTKFNWVNLMNFIVGLCCCFCVSSYQSCCLSAVIFWGRKWWETIVALFWSSNLTCVYCAAAPDAVAGSQWEIRFLVLFRRQPFTCRMKVSACCPPPRCWLVLPCIVVVSSPPTRDWRAWLVGKLLLSFLQIRKFFIRVSVGVALLRTINVFDDISFWNLSSQHRLRPQLHWSALPKEPTDARV